ncbi:hypothetical protein DSM100238_1297 [Bifidobacterium apri]|uniref:Uncharacterized protein n=1 Tax=Bifidobacterium apri TaxID=1769423 RepID=A0A6A2W153_9BIFI|nr:hypothetical protein DSM100238_1297 [Bifidobacterium apri]
MWPRESRMKKQDPGASSFRGLCFCRRSGEGGVIGQYVCLLVGCVGVLIVALVVCTSCMPWHAKLNGYRRKTAVEIPVLRFVHAQAYANRRYGYRTVREAFCLAHDVCHDMRDPAHSNRLYALRRNGSAPIPDTHSGRARKWRHEDSKPRHARQNNPYTRFPDTHFGQ